MIYTGIGSRDIPTDIMQEMHRLAQILAQKGFTLRSGGANGSDLAFEHGCNAANGPKEIYLPWEGFNGNESELFEIDKYAYPVASELYGDRWTEINSSVKKLMARNVHQVLGRDIQHPIYSDMLICWTPDGCQTESKRTRKTGGTGQAIALADRLDIPVFNLFNIDATKRLQVYLGWNDIFEN